MTSNFMANKSKDIYKQKKKIYKMFPTIIYFVPVKIWKDISVSNMLTEESFIVALRLKSLQNEEDCVTTYVVQKIFEVNYKEKY